jgi:hypothetical protein
MKITIDTTNDSKEEIVKIIRLLQDSVRNKNSYNNYENDSYGSSSYKEEKPQEQEFNLGALNFNDKPKVEAVDFSEQKNEAMNDGEPTEAEIQELLRAQTAAVNNSSKSSQPTGAFGAMFGGEEKKDVFSNDPPQSNASNNDIFGNSGFGEEDPDDNYDGDDDNKEEEKDNDWGPRTKMTIGDLERY